MVPWSGLLCSSPAILHLKKVRGRGGLKVTQDANGKPGLELRSLDPILKSSVLHMICAFPSVRNPTLGLGNKIFLWK